MRWLLIICFTAFSLSAQSLSLNKASLEEMASLPLTPEQVDDLYMFVTFQGPVTSIYELDRISSFDSALLEQLKPLVSL